MFKAGYKVRYEIENIRYLCRELLQSYFLNDELLGFTDCYFIAFPLN